MEQTRNMFEKYRFHKNFLMLLLVCDARFRQHEQQLFRHLSYDEKVPIFEHHSLKDIQEEVGIYYLEISQPSSNKIDETARVSAKLLKPARAVEQLAETSVNITKHLKIT